MFDWINPHGVIEASAKEKEDRLERSLKIPQFAVTRDIEYIGEDLLEYNFPPISEYQRRVRNGAPKLVNHVTLAYHDSPRWKDEHVQNAKTEQVCTIPMKPGADHRSLPMELKPWFLTARESKAASNKFYPDRFGRLDLDAVFQTLLTRMDPAGKNGTVSLPISRDFRGFY